MNIIGPKMMVYPLHKLPGLRTFILLVNQLLHAIHLSCLCCLLLNKLLHKRHLSTGEQFNNRGQPLDDCREGVPL